MVRLCITFVTVVYLAFVAQTVLSFMVTSDPGPSNSVTFEVLENEGTNPAPAQHYLLIRALLVDGRLLRWNSMDQTIGWEPDGRSASLRYKGTIQPAVLTFQAKRFVAILQPVQWSGLLRVKRNGRTVQIKNVESAEGPQPPIAVGDPVISPSVGVFLGALVLFAGCAWWFGPVYAGRTSVAWLVFFLAVLHFLYWASAPIGTNNDSPGYFDAFPTVFAMGQPHYFPPGYPALLGLEGSLAGTHLGTWITLTQHGMLVLATVWLYALLRRITSEEAALIGSIMAGALAPSLTVFQDVMSEPATCFAMVGALYYTVRSIETANALFTIPAGLFVGWAGLLRALVPFAALIPALCILHLLPPAKNGFRRLSLTLGIAFATFIAPITWCGYKSGELKLTDSTGFHLYNRVIKEQQLIDEDGPATRKLMTLLAGQDLRAFHPWEIREQTAVRDLSYADQELLLRAVSLEAIRKNPWKYLAYTLPLAWRTFLAPTDWIPAWAETASPLPQFENYPPLAVTSSTMSWRWLLEDIQRELWPILCWAAIAGLLLTLLLDRHPVALALAWVPAGYLLATAAVAFFSPRFNAPTVPFVAVLGVLTVDRIRRMMRESLKIKFPYKRA